MQRLLSEIMEQPDVMARVLEAEYANVVSIAREIQERRLSHVLIAARGTSDNAATYAKYLLGAHNRLPVALAAPSLYTLYDAPPRLQDTLVMGVSQSGASPDIVAVVEDGRRQGMLTLAITNEPESPLASAAQRVILCHAGEERAIAATKTYTAELMALALLSCALGGDESRLTELRGIPPLAQSVLDACQYIPEHAERYRYMSACAIIGRGYNYATAYEWALKVKELTYVGATPYSSADFMHGPIAIVDPDFPVLVVAPSGRTSADILQLLQALSKRRAELVVVSDDEAALALAKTPLRVPVTVDEWLSPLLAIMPGQLFAYHLARVKGLDPERPRGLSKVTLTR